MTRFQRTALTAIVPALLVLVTVLSLRAARYKNEPLVKFGMTGPEVWVVDDAVYHVASTHYERRGSSGPVTYVIRYPVPKGTSEQTMDKDGAGILAWPVIKYAYNNKTFTRTAVPQPVNMAVDLLTSDGQRVLFRHDVPSGK